ncbi:hypothetical protein HDV00_005837 [Rhizophlyctis rosea]|nr:hypothetical protein HDV00_005837 [Rhizophlyctis rosea]
MPLNKLTYSYLSDYCPSSGDNIKCCPPIDWPGFQTTAPPATAPPATTKRPVTSQQTTSKPAQTTTPAASSMSITGTSKSQQTTTTTAVTGTPTQSASPVTSDAPSPSPNQSASPSPGGPTPTITFFYRPTPTVKPMDAIIYNMCLGMIKRQILNNDILHYSAASKANKTQIRRAAGCSGDPCNFRSTGESCDEYAFASSMEGGALAVSACVPNSQNSQQGSMLAAFYRKNKLVKGDAFGVEIAGIACDDPKVVNFGNGPKIVQRDTVVFDIGYGDDLFPPESFFDQPTNYLPVTLGELREGHYVINFYINQTVESVYIHSNYGDELEGDVTQRQPGNHTIEFDLPFESFVAMTLYTNATSLATTFNYSGNITNVTTTTTTTTTIGTTSAIITSTTITKTTTRTTTTTTIAPASTIIQDMACINMDGKCQQTGTSCPQGYLSGYCPSGGDDIRCCPPTRLKGIDYAFDHPPISIIKSAGYSFAVRYLSRSFTTNKNLTPQEAADLHAAGLYVVSNWEYAADAALNGYNQGVQDATQAAQQHTDNGGPADRPIYFSVDFDATSSQMATVLAYFDGIISVLGVNRTGAYGSFAVIKALFDAKKITFGWQTYAWSSYKWDARAQLRQVQNDISVGGVSGCCDRDEAIAADFGQW